MKRGIFEHPVHAVVFDCDGVMFDSKEANQAYYNHILGHIKGRAMTDEETAYSHMSTVNEALAMLFPDPASLSAAQAFRKTFSYNRFIPLMRIEPYLKDLLRFLRPGFKTAIATNRSDTMPGVLSHHGLSGCFDMVVTSLDVARAKPHPESLIKIADALGIPSGEAVYIGDSTVDAEAARAAGMPFISYANPALSPALHVCSLKEVMEMLAPI